MSCVTAQDASDCRTLCCNQFNQCSPSQDQCYVYSELHCVRLGCDNCCLLQETHICGTWAQCNKYVDFFYLWCLLIFGILLVVLLIIKLRTKFMAQRTRQIHLQYYHYKLTGKEILSNQL